MTPEKFILGSVKCLCSSFFPVAELKHTDQSSLGERVVLCTSGYSLLLRAGSQEET